MKIIESSVSFSVLPGPALQKQIQSLFYVLRTRKKLMDSFDLIFVLVYSFLIIDHHYHSDWRGYIARGDLRLLLRSPITYNNDVAVSRLIEEHSKWAGIMASATNTTI